MTNFDLAIFEVRMQPIQTVWQNTSITNQMEIVFLRR